MIRLIFSVGRSAGLSVAAPNGTTRGSRAAPYTRATRSLTVTRVACDDSRGGRGSGAGVARGSRT
jgi:hypothetical protein